MMNRKRENKETRNGKRRNRFYAACLLSVMMLLGGCGADEDIILIGGGESGPAQRIPEESGFAAGSPAEQEETPESGDTIIRVYVCGAVLNPGVVSVPAGSRAEEALQAAGGFREDAGREAVNLADWLTDGQMLYFPTAEEAEEAAREPSAGQDAGTGLVNINTAGPAELCTLPGIGESRAADIIAYREKNGGFRSCEEIMQVPGIKAGAYEKICDKITVK